MTQKITSWSAYEVQGRGPNPNPTAKDFDVLVDEDFGLEHPAGSFCLVSADGNCGFIHDNIDTLYGVPPRPIEELPKSCGCGRALTYADKVRFLSFATMKVEGVVTKDVSEAYTS